MPAYVQEYWNNREYFWETNSYCIIVIMDWRLSIVSSGSTLVWGKLAGYEHLFELNMS